MPDGIAIVSDGHRTRLKWHRLRRRPEDIPFTPARLREGMALGASMEVDLRRRADGGFACLHDETLDRETTGRGPVAAAAFDDLRALHMRGKDGTPTGERLLLLEDLAELAATGATPRRWSSSTSRRRVAPWTVAASTPSARRWRRWPAVSS